MDHQCSTSSRRTSEHPSQKTVTTKSCSSSEAALHVFKWRQSSVVAEDVSFSGGESASDETVTHGLPTNVDPEVFKVLPVEIQKELLSPACINSLPSIPTKLSTPAPASLSHTAEHAPPQAFTVSRSGEGVNEIVSKSESTSTHRRQPAGENVKEERKQTCPHPADCEFPANVDPTVFSELPPDVQRDLMCEWKQQKLVVKQKPGRSFLTKEQKAAGKGKQANSLLKYFKPS